VAFGVVAQALIAAEKPQSGVRVEEQFQ
jgi:hypothetical protein